MLVRLALCASDPVPYLPLGGGMCGEKVRDLLLDELPRSPLRIRGSIGVGFWWDRLIRGLKWGPIDYFVDQGIEGFCVDSEVGV